MPNLKSRIILILAFCSSLVFAQNSNVSVGTETVKDRAILWLKATGNQGLLLPVVANRSSFTGLNNSDDKGMTIYDASDNKVYFWNGSVWVEAGGGAAGVNQTLTLNGNTFTLSGSPASTVNLSSAAPSANQVLMWNATTSQWVATSLGGGDVTGSPGNTTVAGIKGKELPANLPATSSALVYNGTSWVFQPLSSAGTVTQIIAGTGLDGGTITTSGTIAIKAGGVTATELAADAVTSAKIADATITASDIANTTITGAKIAAGTITSDKLAQSAATSGQVLKWNGTAWLPAADDAGVGATPTLSNGQILTGNGTTNAATTLAGDATLSAGTLTIANSAVTSAKIADATITGADIASTTITADKLAQSAAASGQVLKWNGTAWAPAADDAGAGATPTLANGQILTGNGTTNSATALSGDATLSGGVLSISANAVGSTEIADGSVASADITDATITAADIANTTITGAKIAATTITADKLAQSAAAAGQVLKWNGTAWVPSADDAGTIPTLANGQILTGNGTTNSATNLTGDATLAGGAITISTGAVTSAKIADATVTGADIAATTITADKLAQSGATNSQVLQWNGTAWVPATLATGSGTVSSITTGTGLTGGPITTTGTIGLAAGGVTTTELADNSVTSLKIANGAVTGADIAATTIATANIADNAITTAKIATGSVDGSKIVDASITSAKILDGEITNADVSATAAILGSKIVPDFGTQAIVTTGTLSTGGAKLFVDANGNITKINNVTTSFPASQGAAGSVLTNDGTGTLTWTASASFSTLNILPKGDGTTQVASQIYDDGLAVGIGTIVPTGKLEVAHDDNNGGMVINRLNGTAAKNEIKFSQNGTSRYAIGNDFYQNGGQDFFLWDQNALTSRMYFNSNGDLGLGTMTPNAKVHIEGGSQTGLWIKTSALAPQEYGIAVEHAGDGDVAGFFYASNPAGGANSNGIYSQADGAGAGVYGATGGTGSAGIFANWNAANISPVVNIVNNGTGPSLVTAGQVGIGTLNPTTMLDVMGAIKIVDGSQGLGKVLTSDADGVASWQPAGGGGWSLTGNAGTNAATNFIGTTDFIALNFRVGGMPSGKIDPVNISANTFLGYSSGSSNTGAFNTGLGYQTLQSNTGHSNTAIGSYNMVNNTTGFANTTLGRDAMRANTTGSVNTGVGINALYRNTGGNNNTAVGGNAMMENLTGSENTAVGTQALQMNTVGIGNSAMGFYALIQNTADANVAIGTRALQDNTIGTGNTAVGYYAGYTTAFANANTTGSNNTFIGYNSGPGVTTQLTNATAIGAGAFVSASNSLVLGNNANVGIGTTTPSQKLEINDNISRGANLAAATIVANVSGEFGTVRALGNDTGTLAGTINYSYGTLAAYGSSPQGLADIGVVGHVNGNFGQAFGGMFSYGTNDPTTAVRYAALAGPIWAAEFVGDVYVNGSLDAAVKLFKIDHPLDPANKYLSHVSVESPDMMNIYNGNVVTDKNGLAVVELPSYFEALNKEFRYQLTVIGEFAQAIISEKINNNRFTIRTDKPNVEVSWQVTGIRHDPYAEKHRVVPEEMKQGDQRGKYLSPELYGRPNSSRVGFSNNKGRR